MPDPPAPAEDTKPAVEAPATTSEAGTAKAEPAKAAEPKAEAAKPSEDDTPAGISKRQHAINEHIRARARAEQEAAYWRGVAEGKQPAPTAEQQPQTQTQGIVNPNDPKPTAAQFEDYDQFTEALSRWSYRQEQYAASIRAEQARAHQQVAERARTWHERHTAYGATKADYVEKVQPFLDAVYPGTPMFDVLTESPVGPQLAEYFVDNPGEFNRLNSMPLPLAFREIGAIEATLKGSSANPAPTSASAATVAPTKTVSDAPAPPVTLGSRPADAADEADAALARGDFRAYAAATNRREIASRK